MPVTINGEVFYTPKEAAEKLGTNVGMLRYHHSMHRIEGTSLGRTTLYSQPQIDAADFSRKKRGPKLVANPTRKRKSPPDEGDSNNLSVMLLESSVSRHDDRETVGV
jgi:hypothetical protein